MPPFPERESSILAKLKKKKPSSVQEPTEGKEQGKQHPTAQMTNNVDTHVNIQPQVYFISKNWSQDYKMFFILNLAENLFCSLLFFFNIYK